MLLFNGAKPKPDRNLASKSRQNPEHDPKPGMSGHIDKCIKICKFKGDLIIRMNSWLDASDLLGAMGRIAGALPEAERNEAKKVLHERPA